jgi:hypothetical protein
VASVLYSCRLSHNLARRYCATTCKNWGFSASHASTGATVFDDVRRACLPTPNCRLTTLDSENQSQSYFTTGSLPPVHLGAKPLETHDQYFFQLNTCDYSPYVISSDERIGLSFTTAAVPRQRSLSQVRVPSLWLSCFNSPDIASSRTHREHSFQQNFYCFMTSLSSRTAYKKSFPGVLPLVTLRGGTYSFVASLFIVPLPSNGRLFSLNYSGF